MRSIKKINIKKYLLLTLSTTLLISFFTQGVMEKVGIFCVYLGTIANHLMLVEAVLMVVDMGNKVEVDKIRLLTMFLGKFVVLFGALYLGWHFMGNRVFIALLNYVIHIFFLTLCSKKES